MEAEAGILEFHIKALDTGDQAARRELDAYLRVARQHQAIARELRALAGELAAYRSLPMAAHDERTMADQVLEGHLHVPRQAAALGREKQA